MGVKKKISDLAFSVKIEMGNQKTTVEFDADVLCDEEKQTIRPPKKDDGDLPGFYECISAQYEILRQCWEQANELPSDLSNHIKSLIEANDYWLLYCKHNKEITLEAEDIHQRIH